MKQLNQKISIVISVNILIIAALIFGIIFPLLKKIENTSAEFMRAQITTRNLYANWLTLKISDKNLDKVDTKRIDDNFLNPDQALTFILLIENIVQKTNLFHEIKIFTLSTSKETDPKAIDKDKNTVPLQITLWGKFSNLINFFDYFENIPYYAEINSLQIKQISQKDISSKNTYPLEIGDIEATFNINVYTQ